MKACHKDALGPRYVDSKTDSFQPGNNNKDTQADYEFLLTKIKLRLSLIKWRISVIHNCMHVLPTPTGSKALDKRLA